MLRTLFIATTIALLGGNVFAQSPMTQFCFPGQGGVIACPCFNPPAGGGLGCNNFGAGPAKSGTLDASGVAFLSADTVVLNATGENNTSWTAFWTSKNPPNPTGLVHGAGVRCVTVPLKRLYPQPITAFSNASGGAISRPSAIDPTPVSARTAALYGTPILPSETLYYFNTYRDPFAAAPCGNSNIVWNVTNSGSITWLP